MLEFSKYYISVESFSSNSAKVTAEFSMKLAIKKAKESGIGMVVAKGANHYSIAGHWALMGQVQFIKCNLGMRLAHNFAF